MNRVKRINDKKILLVGIPLAGLFVLIVGMYLHGGESGTKDLLMGILPSIFVSATIWLGCRQIVIFLWHRYPWERYPKKHLLVEVFLIPVYAILVLSIMFFLELTFGDAAAVRESFLSSMVIGVLVTLFITSVHEGVFFYNQWKYNFDRSVRLEKDNLEARYEVLKTQVNPHFLFNSLNTLVNMLDDSSEASRFARDLSGFMRYMLINRDKSTILLREEINMIHKYVYLQQSRFGKNLQVSINVPEKYFHYSIPPLALQMLLENALKHNVISQSKPLKIDVFVDPRKGIVVENNLQKKQDVQSTGLGLRNIEERYKFLTAKSVEILESSRIFKVVLPLVITSA
jgi:hypothetical protein